MNCHALHLFLVAATLVCPQLARSQVAPERFENRTAGIALTRPPGWQTVAIQELQANRERIRLSDAELQSAIQQHASAPLFAFAKYREPHPTLNPTIQIILRPSGTLAGLTAVEILEVIAKGLEKGFGDFTYVKSIHATEVSGLAAGHMKATYTMKNAEGTEFRVLSRMWIIPRGAHLFILGMSGPQDGSDLSEDEFAQALASIEIQK